MTHGNFTIVIIIDTFIILFQEWFKNDCLLATMFTNISSNCNTRFTVTVAVTLLRGFNIAGGNIMQ